MVFLKKVSKEEMEVQKFQKELNAEYLNPKETPLRGDNFKNFKKHPFFPLDLKYRVTAKFVKQKIRNLLIFQLLLEKQNLIRNMEKQHLTGWKSYTVTLYQSLDLIKQKI
jgi:hypothetical protein